LTPSATGRDEEISRFLYECELDANRYNHVNYIRWIPFNEFINIEYLAKGGFGEVHKAEWIGYHDNRDNKMVVLKRLHYCSNKILDILKEVKQKILCKIFMEIILNLSNDLIVIKYNFLVKSEL